MTKKRGRPKKSPNERLEERLDLRVSEEEKAIFKLAAAAMNQDLSVWIRVQLHQAASRVSSTRGPRVRKGDKDGHSNKANANRVNSVR